VIVEIRNIQRGDHVETNEQETVEDVMKRYPRIVAHIIAESLGYATPSRAASILRDAKHRQENWCEWIYSCYRCDPLPAVRAAIRNRHYHQGFMAEYKLAKALVDRAIQAGEEPVFASWF
jgi:hypothetical protein